MTHSSFLECRVIHLMKRTEDCFRALDNLIDTLRFIFDCSLPSEEEKKQRDDIPSIQQLNELGREMKKKSP